CLDHRMAAFMDYKLIASGNLGAGVVELLRRGRKRSEHIKLRDRCGSLTDPPRFPRDAIANLQEKILFDFQHLFFSSQNLFFVLLQLGRDESLRTYKRLLAIVIAWNKAEIGLGDLNVVTEYLVEANFQRTNSGAFSLARFNRGEVCFAVL